MHILKRKGSIGILFDQNAGHRGALSLFLNRLASLSELVASSLRNFKHVSSVYISSALASGKSISNPLNYSPLILKNLQSKQTSSSINGSKISCATINKPAKIGCGCTTAGNAKTKHPFLFTRKITSSPKHSNLKNSLNSQIISYLIRLPNWIGRRDHASPPHPHSSRISSRCRNHLPRQTPHPPTRPTIPTTRSIHTSS
jgi:hypothetical protein